MVERAASGCFSNLLIHPIDPQAPSRFSGFTSLVQRVLSLTGMKRCDAERGISEHSSHSSGLWVLLQNLPEIVFLKQEIHRFCLAKEVVFNLYAHWLSAVVTKENIDVKIIS
jgi:hypothetical protein